MASSTVVQKSTNEGKGRQIQNGSRVVSSNSDHCEHPCRSGRALSLTSEDIFRKSDSTGVKRPQSREEVIRTFCDFKNREIILKDDYGSNFRVSLHIFTI